MFSRTVLVLPPPTYLQLHLVLCLLQVLLLGLRVQEGDGRLLGQPLLLLLQLEVGGRGAGGHGRPRGEGSVPHLGTEVSKVRAVDTGHLDTAGGGGGGQQGRGRVQEGDGGGGAPVGGGGGRVGRDGGEGVAVGGPENTD